MQPRKKASNELEKELRCLLVGIRENVVPVCFSEELQKDLKNLEVEIKSLYAIAQKTAAVKNLKGSACVTFNFLQPETGKLIVIERDKFFARFYALLKIIEKKPPWR